ncbi:hypothetical protein EZV62_012668 [Acer yangbiense]|uniref:Uncharacterized protein n=1 Tax=Acer yangbiense TaxID=1000413 RepID=A0A5C7HWW5_9ROSI|nr:hypothetical protein EZV62_012668 [Acer yangbiense]
MIPKQVRALAATGVIFLGGFVTLNITSTITIAALRAANEAKMKKFAMPCGVCKGKGFYICKLCKGNATIQWSPLYDPVFINPCLCPTCDGNSSLVCLDRTRMLIMRGIGNQGTHPHRRHLIQQSDTQEEDSSSSDKYSTKDVHSTTPVQTHGREKTMNGHGIDEPNLWHGTMARELIQKNMDFEDEHP